MTADRELLEKAAKAAGAPIDAWFESAGAYILNRPTAPWWNPLTDDGDALRLAVALRIDIRINAYDTLCYGPSITNSGPAAETHADFPDPYAATRRAIVRAAAAIGETK